MDADTANLALNIIAVAAIVVWVFGLRFLMLSVRSEKNQDAEETTRDAATSRNLLYGSAEIEGAAAELSQRATAMLAEKGVRITERTDERVVFGAEAENAAEQPARLVFSGQMRFVPLTAETTRVHYVLSVPSMRILSVLGFVCQALGLAAIIVGYVVIRQFVVDSDNPAVRWQTFQMMQVVHLLWPPFLFGFLHRRPRRAMRAAFDTFVHNLQFLHD